MLMPKFAVNGFLTQPHFHPEDRLEGLFGEFCPLLQYPYPQCGSSLLFVKAPSANSCRIKARLSSSQVCGIGRNRFGQEA